MMWLIFIWSFLPILTFHFILFYIFILFIYFYLYIERDKKKFMESQVLEWTFSIHEF
jgi:hypothetical protein